MKAKDRKIAMTDIETTGDIPSRHEILEIGLVIFDPKTFEIAEVWETKIKPVRIETAIKEAIDYNGYSHEKWQDAIDLEEAMKVYGALTENCFFASYNVSFDWMFINEAFAKANIENPMSTLENHDRLDLLSIAWDRGLKNEDSFSLRTACKFFDIEPEPAPHNALNGAMTAYKLFRKLEEVKKTPARHASESVAGRQGAS